MAFKKEDVELKDFGAVAVIDTLRATTTMTMILDRGAMAIRPVADLEEAYAIKAHDPQVLLGGERENRPPEGFDGGNSPEDWPRSRVNGRRIAFTTTNGTAAIERVRSVPRLLLAALVNAEACGRYLLQLERPTLLVASGTRGQTSLEDVLACGAVASVWPRAYRTDATEVACALFERERNHLAQCLRESAHGQNLATQGLSSDLEFCGQLNITSVVPLLCHDGWLRGAD